MSQHPVPPPYTAEQQEALDLADEFGTMLAELEQLLPPRLHEGLISGWGLVGQVAWCAKHPEQAPVSLSKVITDARFCMILMQNLLEKARRDPRFGGVTWV